MSLRAQFLQHRQLRLILCAALAVCLVAWFVDCVVIGRQEDSRWTAFFSFMMGWGAATVFSTKSDRIPAGH